MIVRLFAAVSLASMSAPALADPYIGAPEVVRGGGGDTITGVVFHDENRNSRRDRQEAGIPGVLVTNGLDVVRTSEDGTYQLAVREDMDLSVIQPAGWRVPTDRNLVPQFSYTHKPGGTGYEMRYGGLPDTGPAPAAVNFPLIQDGAAGADFTCAVIGDSQTYSNQEISWLRDGVITDVANAGLGADDCLLYVGDVVGDDLGILPRLIEVGAMAGAPQWMVHGNHDYDFDARSDDDSADSWRRIWGPNYYAFEMGQALFVVLDNVIYPCGPEDAATGHAFCAEGERPTYNGRVTETQLTWLETLLAHTPEDRLIVLAHHIPFVSFVDAGSDKHQTDNLDRIHALVEGRPALSLSGHTHTIENHAPGQIFEGWAENTGTGPLPFRHIIAGAASGAWYQGDFNVDGNPMALQRMGAPNGYLHLDFTGTNYAERYLGQRIDPERGQWAGLSTPAFRNWYEAIMAWRAEDWQTRDPLPPLTVNDLPDTGIITPPELAEGVLVTANVWAGSAETIVAATLPDGRQLAMTRTQEGAGEAPRIGSAYADPASVERQLTVGRYAYQSRSGDPRAQGFELYQGATFGPAMPQPQRVVADRNMHLWTVQLPQDLPLGVHRITVSSTDRNGLTFTDAVIVEVREERPQMRFRSELWEE
ncbi:MAG: calcineurin-like phosphoesterase family protein [Alphaproteobacteria bacterium]|nr:calcineurin-like phosphoesterase family protein [Alphaproteobacteria bacterium]